MKIKQSMPEMPKERIERYTKSYGLPYEDAVLLTAAREFSDFYDDAVKINPDYKQIANMMVGEVSHMLNTSEMSISDVPFTPAGIAETVKMVSEGKINLGSAKQIVQLMFERGGKPEKIAEKRGFIMSSDSSAIEEIADKFLAENADSVAKYKAGNDKLFGFFMGQIMRLAGKSANPKLIKDVLTEKLK